jgi:hypothetical protein
MRLNLISGFLFLTQTLFAQTFIAGPQPPPFEGVSAGSIAFADVDGDGDPDVLITGENNSDIPTSTLYTNDGSGNFTEVTGTPFEGVFRSSIAFADVDGDGDPDVLITGLTNSLRSISKLYTNDGMVSSTDDLMLGFNLDFTPYPNPTASNVLNVRFDSAEKGFVVVHVYDLNGRLLRQQKEFVVTGQQIISMDITALSAGSYFIQLDNGKRTGVARFIVH